MRGLIFFLLIASLDGLSQVMPELDSIINEIGNIEPTSIELPHNAADMHAEINRTMQGLEAANQQLLTAVENRKPKEIADALVQSGAEYQILGNYYKLDQPNNIQESMAYKKSHKFLNLAIWIGNSIGYSSAKMEAYVIKGFNYRLTIMPDSALICYLIADSIATDISTIKHLEVLGYISRMFFFEGDFVRALEYNFKRLEIIQGSNEYDSIKADILLQIGKNYNEIGNTNRAKYFLTESVTLFENSGSESENVYPLHHLGRAYFKEGDYILAEEFFNKSLQLNDSIYDKTGQNNKTVLPLNYLWLGRLFAELGQLQRATDLYKQALAESKKYYMVDLSIQSLNYLGESYLVLGDYSKSLTSLTEAKVIAKKVNYRKDVMTANKLLADYFSKTNQPEKALQHYKLYAEQNDNIFNEINAARVAEIQTSFETANKERQILLLKKDREIDAIRLETQRKLNYSILAITVLLLAIMVQLYISFKKSIATRKQIEEKNLKLIELDREKNQLMGIVVHDLKSPLNNINACANIIKIENESLEKEHKEYLDTIIDSVMKLSSMINRILEAQSMESIDNQAVITSVDMVNVVENSIFGIQNRADKKKIQIRLNVVDPINECQADPKLASLIFDNLLSNAIKFSPHNTQIVVEISANSKNLIVKVIDEGPGISSEDMKKLYKKFQKLSARPTGDEVSTGLGLSIVKKYVEDMNGSILCESEIDKGTTFIVQLPLN